MLLKRLHFIFAHDCIKKGNDNFSRRLLSFNIQEKTERRERWKSTVGLEVHAQIATESKLFSNASTDFASSINSCVALFDCATPGTLPVNLFTNN